ncbi:MAG: aldo/keto reductase [Caldicoprobacterales bacterium]|jgi:myo-inositol catabolism protein IolS|nr:aldo/keto reductase [Clostridiales bacterium]
MQKRRLGKSDIFVSPIGMGCWAYGGGEYWGKQNQDDVNRVVSLALDMGINLFDTAEMYNNGASEISLGQALRGRREEAVICSKVSPSNAYEGELQKHCEASLKRLNTDYIDVYMLHWPLDPISIKHFTDDPKKISEPPAVQEAFGALLDLKKQGKIREIGISNFGHEQMKEVLDTGAEPVMNEMTYNILSRAIEKEVLPYCIEKDISIVGSMALQQGLLAGIYQKPEDVPPHQAHSRHFRHERGKGTSRHGEAGAETEVFEVVQRLREIADGMGIHIAQLSIAWVLAKTGIACTLVGSRNEKELLSNIKAAELNLTTELVREIDRLSEPVLEKLGHNPDYYENPKNSRIR